ncbi:MAG: response regulator [Desulfobacterales bacterium]
MSKKILIVDDDPTVVRYLIALFEDNGYTTKGAACSKEAFARILEDMPDLICLDLQMPGEWGPRLYRKLRKDPALRDIPVIVISGIDGDHAIRNARAFVRKPFDPEKLLGIVKSTIG